MTGLWQLNWHHRVESQNCNENDVWCLDGRIVNISPTWCSLLLHWILHQYYFCPHQTKKKMKPAVLVSVDDVDASGGVDGGVLVMILVTIRTTHKWFIKQKHHKQMCGVGGGGGFGKERQSNRILLGYYAQFDKVECNARWKKAYCVWW